MNEFHGHFMLKLDDEIIFAKVFAQSDDDSIYAYSAVLGLYERDEKIKWVSELQYDPEPQEIKYTAYVTISKGEISVDIREKRTNKCVYWYQSEA